MNQPSLGQVCWTELITADLKQAKDFYAQMHGWHYREITNNEITYTIIQAHGEDIGGMWQIPPEHQRQVQPYWLNYLLVSDVQEALTRAKKYGATEIKEVTKVGDMGYFAVIADPTGAKIAFWQTAT